MKFDIDFIYCWQMNFGIPVYIYQYLGIMGILVTGVFQVYIWLFRCLELDQTSYSYILKQSMMTNDPSRMANYFFTVSSSDSKIHLTRLTAIFHVGQFVKRERYICCIFSRGPLKKQVKLRMISYISKESFIPKLIEKLNSYEWVQI